MDLNSVSLQVNDLAHALKGLLSRFANDKGVTVKYHESKPLIRFQFKTTDDIPLVITYDINETSKDYIDSTISGVQKAIMDERKKRNQSSIIIV